MDPKVKAVCRFIRATGFSACIGNLADAAKVIEGIAGTHIVK
jgi:carbamate kinase